MTYSYTIMPSPLGELTLVAKDNALAAILWENDRPGRVKLGSLQLDNTHPVLQKTQAQLKEYFAGKRDRFELDLDMQGTPFQKKVWTLLLAIPFGQTRSYGQLAQLAGNPAASRAVGAAVGRNPVSIVTPCHRVVGSSGKLTGFAGGLDAKRTLLQLESQSMPAQ